MKGVAMARAATHKPKITLRNAKRWLEWCNGRRRHWTLEQWNHASPSGSPTDESGFGGCQEKECQL